MMKICMITTSYPRYNGDYAGIFVHNLAKELVKQGIKVSILAPHDKDTKDHEIIDGVEINRFQYWFTKQSHKLTYGEGIPYNFTHSFLAKIQLPVFLFLFFLKSLKISKSCDIVHAHFLPAGFLSVLIKKIFGKKLVITVHGSDLLTVPKNKLLKKIYIGLLTHSDRIVAVSNANKEILVNLGFKEDMVVVIPNGIYLSEYASAKEHKKKNEVQIVWAGRMIKVKGLKYLIKAMKIVVSHHPNSKLILIGDGPLKYNLMKLSDELSITDNVDFAGYIKNEAIPNYLENTDIFVLPSTFEGFGIAALEAMSYSTPIVGSEIGGIVDLVKDQINGLLVEPENYEQLAEKICYLIEHPKDGIRMGREGRKIAEKSFKWEKIAGRTIELYSRLLMNNDS